MSVEGVDVLVVGEALVDVVERGASVVEHVGGSPANVALGLGRRGIRTVLLTQVGADDRGERVRRHLADSGVEVAAESAMLARTSTATAYVASDGAATYEFDVLWESFPAVSPIGSSVLHTGSIAAFLEPGASSVRELLAESPARWSTFDPNVRPALMPEHPDAVDEFEAVASLVSIVKMSDEDAGWLYPARTITEVIDEVLKMGPALVAVTLGSEGAILASEAGQVHVPGIEVEVVDTVGAGDTFMASLICSVLEGGVEQFDVEALARFGRSAVAAAAITVSRAGADLPWNHELRARVAQDTSRTREL